MFTMLRVLGPTSEDFFTEVEHPKALFRFSTEEQAVRDVILRGDVMAPNGFRVSMDGTRLYVADAVR